MGGGLDAAQGWIIDLICSYPWPCQEALAVVYGPTPPNNQAPEGCPTGESGGNPSASNAGNEGLFQVNRAAHARRLRLGESLLDPVVNVRVAYDIFLDNAGWGPWSCRP